VGCISSIQVLWRKLRRCNWLTAVLLLLRFVSDAFPISKNSGERTGTGLRRAMVCRIKSCGLWRIAIMRVGCMAIMRVGCMERALVALNMLAVLVSSQLEWRVERWRRRWGIEVLRGFRHRHADAESSRSLLARKTPSELCVDKASRVEPSQPHNFTSVTTSPNAALPLPPTHFDEAPNTHRNHV